MSETAQADPPPICRGKEPGKPSKAANDGSSCTTMVPEKRASTAPGMTLNTNDHSAPHRSAEVASHPNFYLGHSLLVASLFPHDRYGN
jgi:hypothetical protein